MATCQNELVDEHTNHFIVQLYQCEQKAIRVLVQMLIEVDSTYNFVNTPEWHVASPEIWNYIPAKSHVTQSSYKTSDSQSAILAELIWQDLVYILIVHKIEILEL